MQINWNKWNLFYRLNKILYFQQIDIKVNLHKLFNILNRLKKKGEYKKKHRVNFVLFSKFSIYRIIFVINKFLYKISLVKVYKHIKFNLYLYWQNLKKS